MTRRAAALFCLFATVSALSLISVDRPAIGQDCSQSAYGAFAEPLGCSGGYQTYAAPECSGTASYATYSYAEPPVYYAAPPVAYRYVATPRGYSYAARGPGWAFKSRGRFVQGPFGVYWSQW